MKKKLTLILILSFILGAFSFSTAAVEENNLPVVCIEGVAAQKGDNVSVRVLIKNNPGIWGMDLKISYDKSALTLESVENGDFYSDTEWTPGNLKSDIYILSYEADGLYDITKESGTLAVLNFKVRDTAAEGDYFINATYNAGDIINIKFDDIIFDIENSKVTVEEKSNFGDCNGDGKIDTTDLASLKLYLAGAGEAGSGADCNGDGMVDTTDLAALKLYLAGAGILGPK